MTARRCASSPRTSTSSITRWRRWPSRPCEAAGFKVADGRGRLGDARPAPQRPRAVGHLHHPLALPARTRADRHVVPELAHRLGRTRQKSTLADQFTTETDPAKRKEVFAKMQARTSRTSASSRSATSMRWRGSRRGSSGVTPSPWPFFWNATQGLDAERKHRDAEPPGRRRHPAPVTPGRPEPDGVSTSSSALSACWSWSSWC